MTTETSTPPLDLAVEGMTCGSCSARVQRTLEKQPGVATAEVNFATGLARVHLDGAPDLDGLAEAVEAAGYTLLVPPAAEPRRSRRGHDGCEGDHHTRTEEVPRRAATELAGVT